MYPVLFRIGALTLRSYGMMLAIAFLVGVVIAQWRAKLERLDPSSIADLSVIILISGVAGARLHYFIFHFKEFGGNPWRLFAVWEGGLTFYGGVIFALIFGIVYIGRKRIPFSKVADAIAPSLALGVFLTRIGCFLNGCCFGKPTSFPLGVSFPPGSFPWEAWGEAHIHPTQLYESGAGLAMFAILLLAHRSSILRGSLLWLFLALYSVWRFSVDFIRYYEPYKHLFGGPLVVNQLVSLLLLVLSVVMIIRSSRRKLRD